MDTSCVNNNRNKAQQPSADHPVMTKQFVFHTCKEGFSLPVTCTVALPLPKASPCRDNATIMALCDGNASVEQFKMLPLVGRSKTFQYLKFECLTLIKTLHLWAVLLDNQIQKSNNEKALERTIRSFF